MKSKSHVKDKKLIVILGATASGKTELAIKLAKKFNGEVINADSRQVYKGMDIGTAKPPSREFAQIGHEFARIVNGIPHYLLDVASPKRKFTVAQYRKFALKAIEKIQKRKKIPFLVGGSWFYIRAIVDGLVIPEVPPDWKLRKKLEKKSPEELYEILKKLDPQRAKTIEKENPRRLIRAIEICKKIGKVPPLKFKPLPYPVLMIGIKRRKKELEERIKKRFFEWLKEGLILEVIKLRKEGVSFKRIEEFGMHYREIARYLQGKISEKEMVENSIREIQNYAKKQTNWFKKDKRIKWIKKEKEAKNLISNFLKIKKGGRQTLTNFEKNTVFLHSYPFIF
jgi:tRNA dimethylallyltransferase